MPIIRSRLCRRLPHLVGAVLMCIVSSGASQQPSHRPDPARGRALITHTRDSLPAHVGNALDCTSCHFDAGRRLGAPNFLGAAFRYPSQQARAGRVITLDDRINECFRRSLAGQPLAIGSRDLEDIKAWIRRLSPPTTPAHVRRQPELVLKDATPGDADSGRVQYASRCAWCHGGDGLGRFVAGEMIPWGPKRDLAWAPPLWGQQSFAIASGLSRRTKFAAFIRHNMPPGASPKLTEQEARDIAAYVLQHERPAVERQEEDFPNGGAPVDLPYRILSRPDSAR
jgi:thiosulfate dehydrogenase